MRLEELRALLETARDRRMPHVERLTVTAAVVSEQLKPRGMIATLVGGAAIELHARSVRLTRPSGCLLPQKHFATSALWV